jgi:MoxR-like ATPase
MNIRSWADSVVASIENVFFGKGEVIEQCLAAVLCKGHVLIEDLPGVGKTLLGRALAVSLGGKFKQIQCTPDLLPSDVLGVSVFNPKSGEFVFKEGPVMTNVLLVDEINRATPRTQSSLLEAMAEGQVSVEGRSLQLPQPFLMIATQSPVDSEGTFPLPEVQKDRFFLSLNIGYPDRDSESAVMKSGSTAEDAFASVETVSRLDDLMAMQQAVVDVHVDERLKSYILELVKATRTDPRLYMGVSPRGSLALFKGAQAVAALRGRDYAVPEDVKEIVGPVLGKRVLIKSEFTAKGLTENAYLQEIIGKLEVPGYREAAVSQ